MYKLGQNTKAFNLTFWENDLFTNQASIWNGISVSVHICIVNKFSAFKSRMFITQNNPLSYD